ncbi:heme exporter protein CcmD [Rhizobium sp. WYJ-E13]|uniref:heme exporter protein CcmD n=1 Tax=Rhizobium sp. WYJ-E13 TaxID=2849093 RepID=UPI001C1EC315|nr:heme exporter protein CcmD [Rhizobium sp. WYJ-E13]QWW70814.1 heme exporter protein CcmD [Rhizobium sp. WYJ-E13]
MPHQDYVLAAHTVAFAVIIAMSAMTWFRGRTYRRQVEVVAKTRHRARHEVR